MANKDNSEAAKKIAKVEKEKTSKKSSKNKENVFVRMGKTIKRFFKDLRGETKKITWPGAKEVLKGTLVTIVCIAIIGVAVFLVDLGLTQGINGLRTLAENRTTTTETTTTTTTTTTTAPAANSSTDAAASSAAQ